MKFINPHQKQGCSSKGRRNFRRIRIGENDRGGGAEGASGLVRGCWRLAQRRPDRPRRARRPRRVPNGTDWRAWVALLLLVCYWEYRNMKVWTRVFAIVYPGDLGILCCLLLLCVSLPFASRITVVPYGLLIFTGCDCFSYHIRNHPRGTRGVWHRGAQFAFAIMRPFFKFYVA
jgi:hypothetical protein